MKHTDLNFKMVFQGKLVNIFFDQIGCFLFIIYNGNFHCLLYLSQSQ